MPSFACDRSLLLDVNGTRQRLRLCAARLGLPPLLVVQAGPGLPLLHEAGRFQHLLALEDHFTVAYWDQRGCGPAPLRDARSVSLASQADDLSWVLRWLAGEIGQPVVVLGISLGAALAVRAARSLDAVRAVVAVSIDADSAMGDAGALAFLREAACGDAKLKRAVAKLGPPPYVAPGPFQARARLLSDQGAIEHGGRFGSMLRRMLGGLVATYGMFGAVAALRNMQVVQKRLLPELAGFDLFAGWVAAAVPVHYLFGGADPLCPEALGGRLSPLLGREDSVRVIPGAAHMVHFDQPAAVRAALLEALGRS
ncbi:MAG TPA: alpha/beta hydrolase [Magnetospirillum sp.]|nr:alpha/beta hydrolase [Magnetospirillum sp.]